MPTTLLETLLALESEAGARRLQRARLYDVVTRLVTHLRDILRCGDRVAYETRIYELGQLTTTSGESFYPFTVNNGRGPAMLGERVVNTAHVPFASFEEHIFFAEHAGRIIDLFGGVLKQDTQRIGMAEQFANTEAHTIERIIV
jgi:hypothetical protein